MLQYTSCLFATVVVHAYYDREWLFHHIYLLLLATSLLYRGNPGSKALLSLDMHVAHAAMGALVGDIPTALYTGHAWLLAFPVAVGVLWAIDHSERVHALLHVTTVVGMHCWLHCL